MAIHDNQRFGLAIGGHIGKVNDRLASVSGGGVEQGKSFAVQNVTTIDISRENLAAVAGVAKESLIRTLGDFRDEQLITLKEGQIAFLSIKKLAEMVN